MRIKIFYLKYKIKILTEIKSVSKCLTKLFYFMKLFNKIFLLINVVYLKLLI